MKTKIVSTVAAMALMLGGCAATSPTTGLSGGQRVKTPCVEGYDILAVNGVLTTLAGPGHRYADVHPGINMATLKPLYALPRGLEFDVKVGETAVIDFCH